MSNTKNTSMTSGNTYVLLFRFALSLIAGNVFQQLYTVVDAAIVGRGVGTSALASLGAADWLIWFVLGSIQGFTQGFSIETAAAYGEENAARLNRSVRHSFFLSAVLSVLFTAGSLLFLRQALTLLGTPADIFDGSVTYLSVIYGGCTIITFYNLFASLLRSFGDSRTPLYAMIAASLNNIVLDLLFVYVLHMGIFGAAFATIISQLLACIICFLQLRKSISFTSLLPVETDIIKQLLKLGAPLALQVIIIAAGGLVLQTFVNGYGSVFVAGYTAANKMFGILESAAISFGYGILTYTAQNLGAGKKERLSDGIKAGIVFSLSVSLLIAFCMIMFGDRILGMFVDASSAGSADVIAVGYQYLSVMAYCLPALYILHLYKNALMGLGLTVKSMNSGFVELAIRIVTVFILTRRIGSSGIFYAEVAAWFGAAIYLCAEYYVHLQKA